MRDSKGGKNSRIGAQENAGKKCFALKLSHRSTSAINNVITFNLHNAQRSLKTAEM
jgi:hypothetical protein